MKFTSKLDKDDHSDLYHWFFQVPNEVAEQLIEGTDRRVVTKVNEVVKYHCAIYGDGLGGYRILLNRERSKKLGLVRGETIRVELAKDRSEYGVDMSEELREVLDQRPLADALFHKLTKGAQRTLIYWSDNVKSSEIKIRRALVMTEHLENQHGKPDFRLMNEEMKVANRAAKRV